MDNAPKRIFVAVGTAPELQEAVAAWAAAHGALPVRWLSGPVRNGVSNGAGKNLHVTLVPPWYERDTDAVARKLAPLRGFAPFAVRFDRIVYGPSPREPRLIWAEGTAPQELIELKQKIELLLGVHPEARPFRLHLTLARLRTPKRSDGGQARFRPEQFASFPMKRLDERVSWTEEIRSVLLMESHLSPAGADYEVLADIPLRGSAD